jgi:hypothetical protein
MAGGPAAAVYAVLSLSNGLGGVVKGVTGFGSAITNILIWVVFSVLGVDAGAAALSRALPPPPNASAPAAGSGRRL